MTITDDSAHGSRFMRVRMNGATLTGMSGYAPVTDERLLGDVRVSIIVDDSSTDVSDDDLVRGYVSHLWAQDWDSDEDAVYDTW